MRSNKWINPFILIQIRVMFRLTIRVSGLSRIEEDIGYYGNAGGKGDYTEIVNRFGGCQLFELGKIDNIPLGAARPITVRAVQFQ